MKELPLAIVDGVTAKPCVRSGFCCKQAPCPFGTWNKNKTQCEYLYNDGRYFCGIAEQIVQNPSWELSPAFGAGCCSPLNSDRRRILQEKAASSIGSI